jgi:hypothetical protein
VPYNPSDIEQIEAAAAEWFERGQNLATGFLTLQFQNQSAREFTQHGLSRRLNILRHSIDRVFYAIPLTETAPTRESVLDATCYLQTFVINAFGSIDNLARVWLAETRRAKPNGKPLSKNDIGFGPKNEIARTSLPQEFQTYLASTDDWFGYLADYRHALAHRIPLYIPPKVLNNENTTEYQRIEALIEPAIRERDFVRWDVLMNEQAALGVFEPVMMHSYGEKAKPVRVHPQMVCDYATVVEIGEHTLRALEAMKLSET